ncbi:MAG: class I SAM-dependent methyltransferase [Pseudomonadales bacterium]
MSSTDREKWDARYRQGAYSSRTQPSALLTEFVPEILATQRAVSGEASDLRALDLACGAGRNALYLAGLGYAVDALDISAEALRRGQRDAEARGLTISWIAHDLDHGLPRRLPEYDLVVLVRYLDLSLVAAVAEVLRPGGQLICEAHLESDQPVIGPRDSNFRARPGELRGAALGLDIAEYWEGHTQDPDGRAVALVRLVAGRRYPAV